MISAGETPTVYWQGLAYIVLTAAEVMVSVTGLNSRTASRQRA